MSDPSPAPHADTIEVSPDGAARPAPRPPPAPLGRHRVVRRALPRLPHRRDRHHGRAVPVQRRRGRPALAEQHRRRPPAGPALVGVVAAVVAAVGLRAGSRGGPLALEKAEVRYVLLAPVDRRRALLAPALRQVRFALVRRRGRRCDRRSAGGPAPPGTLLPWAASGAVAGALIGLLDSAPATWPAGSAPAPLGRHGRRRRPHRLGRGRPGWEVPSPFARHRRPGHLAAGAPLVGAGRHPRRRRPRRRSVWLRLGRLSLEAAERRTRSSASSASRSTVRDLRTVMVLRRQLVQEQHRMPALAAAAGRIPATPSGDGTCTASCASRRPASPAWPRSRPSPRSPCTSPTTTRRRPRSSPGWPSTWSASTPSSRSPRRSTRPIGPTPSRGSGASSCCTTCRRPPCSSPCSRSSAAPSRYALNPHRAPLSAVIAIVALPALWAAGARSRHQRRRRGARAERVRHQPDAPAGGGRHAADVPDGLADRRVLPRHPARAGRPPAVTDGGSARPPAPLQGAMGVFVVVGLTVALGALPGAGADAWWRPDVEGEPGRVRQAGRGAGR